MTDKSGTAPGVISAEEYKPEWERNNCRGLYEPDAIRFAQALSDRNLEELERKNELLIKTVEALNQQLEELRVKAFGLSTSLGEERLRAAPNAKPEWRTDEPPQEESILALIEYNHNSHPIEEHIVCVLRGDDLEDEGGDDIGWPREVIKKWIPLSGLRAGGEWEAGRDAAADWLDDSHECDCGAPRAKYSTECGHAMNCPKYEVWAIRMLIRPAPSSQTQPTKEKP